jgi:hypothetical protein
MMKTARFSTLFFALALVGCGDDSDENSGAPATSAQFVAFCKSDCAREIRCATSTDAVDPQCNAKCDAMAPNEVAAANVKAEFITKTTSCYTNLACGQDEDTCGLQVIAAMNDDAAKKVVEQCKTRQGACGGEINDVTCAFLPALTSAGQAKAVACLAESCSSVDSCVEGLFGPR